MTVFGTRPDTIKMAPVVRALRAAEPAVVPLVCVTAQHRQMLDDLLALFALVPDYDLDVMRHDQTITQITTRVLEGLEPVLREARPDVVLVHGDTSTSTAAALAAFYAKIPVGHVEAGLRTRTIWEPFPEEMNRRLTGRLASFHFAPTGRARANLEAEAVAPADIIVTGNTVIDAFLAVAAQDAPPRVRGVGRARSGAALDFRDGASAREPRQAARDLRRARRDRGVHRSGRRSSCPSIRARTWHPSCGRCSARCRASNSSSRSPTT